MKIMESTLSFFSSRQYEQKKTSKKELVTWRNPVPPPIVQAPPARAKTQPQNIENLFLKLLVDILTGKTIKISNIQEFQPEDPGLALMVPPTLETVPEPLGWGMRYSEFNSYHEAETTQFKTVGAVTTADGKTIDFTLELEMQRQFYTEERYELLTGDALKDPLVINFNGNSADLTDTRFSFDINGDGQDETIAWLAQGSGFLVLDRNKDGVVNDGSELFGPETGNGFYELSRFDTDHNGWIDENDPVFEDLRIWSGPSRNASTLQSLEESEVGAISLSTAGTEFTLKDESNTTKGKIQRTGVYIAENGSVDTIQQLDLVV